MALESPKRHDGAKGSCNRRLRHPVSILKVAVAVATFIYGLLHVQFQILLDGFHNENPSFVSATLGLSGQSDGGGMRQQHATTTTEIAPKMETTPKVPPKRRGKNKPQKVPSEFQHQEGVVIVTKIHGPHQMQLLKQSMCLFHYAYNQRVLYDIVVFTAEPVPAEDISGLQKLVAPSNITVVMDNRGLQEEVEALSPHRRSLFLERCKHHNQLSDSATEHAVMQNLTWFSDCGDGRLAYNWQAEFRSLHIWNHHALLNHKWMLWMDTDAFCTKMWDRDPIAFAIHHNLAIFFDNFPGGGSRGLSSKIAQGFNVSLCKSRVTPQGEFESTLGTAEEAISNPYCNNTHLRSVYGFLHITNMEFYRSPQVLHGIQTLLGDNFLARDPDDQQAVTIPAAVLAPERSWDMRRKGIQLDVFHNLHMDGKNSEKVKGYVQLWKTSKLREEMGDAKDACPVTEAM